MKKLLFLGLSVLTAALPAGAENKIQMVTYFPVPYVAYSQINPTKQLGGAFECVRNEFGLPGKRGSRALSVASNDGTAS